MWASFHVTAMNPLKRALSRTGEEADLDAIEGFRITANLNSAGIEPGVGLLLVRICPDDAEMESGRDAAPPQHLPGGQRSRQANHLERQHGRHALDGPAHVAGGGLSGDELVGWGLGLVHSSHVTRDSGKRDDQDREAGGDDANGRFQQQSALSPRLAPEPAPQPANSSEESRLDWCSFRVWRRADGPCAFN